MSDSLFIYSNKSLDIDVRLLQLETEKVFRFLLNQKDKEILDLRFYKNIDVIEDKLLPDGEIYRFAENKIIGHGSYIYYGIDEYWQSRSSIPIYEFCITEIPRSRGDGLLAVCLSMTIAVAKIMSVDFIVDYSGIWCQSESDQIYVEDLLKLAIMEDLPINSAIQVLYDKSHHLLAV